MLNAGSRSTYTNQVPLPAAAGTLKLSVTVCSLNEFRVCVKFPAITPGLLKPPAKGPAEMLEFLRGKALLKEHAAVPHLGKVVGELGGDIHTECVERVVLSPKALVARAVNIFLVNANNDLVQACRESSAPASCRAIQGRCATVGWAIFCDERAVARLENISHGTCLDVRDSLSAEHGESTDFAEREVGSLRALIAKEAASLQPAGETHGQYAETVVSAASHSSVDSTEILVTSVLLSLMIGREIFYVERFGCPTAEFVFNPPQQNFIDLYESSVCVSVDTNEMHAELRSIELAQMLIDRSLAQKPSLTVDKSNPENEGATDIETRIEQHARGVVAASVARAGLYAMVTEAGMQRGEQLLAGEPTTGKVEDLASYYRAESRKRWGAGVRHPDLSTGMVVGMLIAMRLAVFDYEDEVPALLSGQYPASVRLVHSLIGDVTGAEEMSCHKDAKEAAADAFALVMGMAFWRHAPTQ